MFVGFTSTKNIFLYNSERELYSFVKSNVFIFTIFIINSLEGKFHTEGNFIPAEISLWYQAKYLWIYIRNVLYGMKAKKNLFCIWGMWNIESKYVILPFQWFYSRVFDTFVLIMYAPPMCCFLCNEIMCWASPYMVLKCLISAFNAEILTEKYALHLRGCVFCIHFYP